MKKFKLITSLSTIGIIAATTPIVATSCANSEKLNIVLNTTVIKPIEESLFANLLYGNGDLDYIKDINVISSDANILEVIEAKPTSYGTGIIGIKCYAEGSIKLSIEVSDYKNNSTKRDFIIEIKDDVDENLTIIANVVEYVALDGSEEFPVSAQYLGKNIRIKSCDVISSDESILSGSYENGIVTLSGHAIGKVSLIIRVTDIKGRYNDLVVDTVSVV